MGAQFSKDNHHTGHIRLKCGKRGRVRSDLLRLSAKLDIFKQKVFKILWKIWAQGHKERCSPLIIKYKFSSNFCQLSSRAICYVYRLLNIDLKAKGFQTMKEKATKNMSYLRFLAMILTSVIVMYGIKYLTSYQIIEHAYFSETRLYMALVMGAAMAVIMLSFMLGMYKNKAVNSSIFIGSAVLFATALWLARSQTTVDDLSYMKAMIPHHSIAIMTSERAGIKDKRVRELANEIIKAQRKEIKEMSWLIKDIEKNGIAGNEQEKSEREIPVFKGSL